MAVLGYLTNLKRSLGLLVHFLVLLYLLVHFVAFGALSVDKVQCHIFFLSEDIKQNVLISLQRLMNFKIYLWLSPKAIADRQKNGGETEIQKCEYLENEKSFLDEIKNIFHENLKVIIWWKKWKIVDTSFKYTRLCWQILILYFICTDLARLS